MKALLLIAVCLLTACTDPMFTADMAVSNAGVSVNPTLSGKVGDATVSVQSN